MLQNNDIYIKATDCMQSPRPGEKAGGMPSTSEQKKSKECITMPQIKEALSSQNRLQNERLAELNNLNTAVYDEHNVSSPSTLNHPENSSNTTRWNHPNQHHTFGPKPMHYTPRLGATHPLGVNTLLPSPRGVYKDALQMTKPKEPTLMSVGRKQEKVLGRKLRVQTKQFF